MSTGDGVVGYGDVDLFLIAPIPDLCLIVPLYWGRCGRDCRFTSLLGTLW